MKRKSTKIAGKVFRYVIWSVLSITTLFPIYWCFLTGIRGRADIFSYPPKLYQLTFYWENFTKTLMKGPYGSYLLNSVIIATGNTILVTVLAILAAYALSRYKIKGSQNIFFWTITNRMAPPAAFMLPMFILFSNVLRIGDSNLYDTHIGVIMVYCLFNLPFAIWLLKGIIDGISPDIDEAARVDGATTMGIIWKIIVPLALPSIATTAILSWIFAWNEFLFASTITSVNARTFTAGLNEFVSTSQTYWGELAAMSIIGMIPAFIFLGLIQKYIVAGLTFGAVRE